MMHRVFIIGGAGYVGEMLCEQFARRSDVEMIVVLDKSPITDRLQAISKLNYIQHNMADDGWQARAAEYQPDIVVHTAWQIRAMYGNAAEQWRWNVDGSDKVFDFVFTTPSVQKLVYFSTAASYSARADNRLDYLFTEEDPLRDDDYIYAKEKKTSEEHLRAKYEAAKAAGGRTPQVFVLRPSAITGPRGRFMRIRFGLQSALQGTLKKSLLDRVVTAMTAFVPANRTMVRQFIHEDDVTDIVAFCAFNHLDAEYEVFNITPPGEVMMASDIARAVGKRVLPITPLMTRVAFGCIWHLTRGRIPTCPHTWRFYSYPLLLDGSKISQKFGYQYHYSSPDAFTYTNGRYQDFVPEEFRNPKP